MNSVLYLWMALGYRIERGVEFGDSLDGMVMTKCHALKRYIARIVRQGRGSTLILFAVALPVLLGFAGFAIDGSHAYLQQQRMQIAADAAALAGARLLALGASDTTQVRNEVASLATLNGATSFTLGYLNDNSEVHVTTTRIFDTYFAQIIGIMTMTVTASANAAFGSVSKINNLMPMTFACGNMADYIIGVEYTLRDSANPGPGNVGWLTWEAGDVSSPDLADNIWNRSNSPMLAIDDVMYGSSGNMGSFDVKAALDFWINKVVTIPLYKEPTGTGSNARYRVCAFAQFVLIRFDNTGNDKTVTGKFVRSVVSGTDFAVGGPDFGSRDIRLTQ